MGMWDEFSFLENASKYDDNWSLDSWCNNNGERGKLISKEWDIELNISAIDIPIEISEVSAKESQKKYWWKCSECNNKFKMTPWCRTMSGQGCPKCGIKRRAAYRRREAAKNSNDLLTWCNNHGEFGSTLEKEWDSEKNMKLHGISINEISQKSSLEASWICSRCGNHYTKMVYKRVALGLGCTACTRNGTSFPEQVIYRSMLQVFSDTLSRKKLFDNIEYDIYIPGEKVAIEYNGSYWHEKKETRDKMKKDLCMQHGIRLYSINADNGCKCEISFERDVISYNISTTKHNAQLKEIVNYLLGKLGHSIEEVDFEKAVDESYGRMLGYIEDNFTKYEPRLVEEWDWEKNKGIEPEYFTVGSSQRVFWKCKRCGFEFENSIYSRIHFQSGCGKCGYNVFDDKVHNHGGSRHKIVPFGLNSL